MSFFSLGADDHRSNGKRLFKYVWFLIVLIFIFLSFVFGQKVGQNRVNNKDQSITVNQENSGQVVNQQSKNEYLKNTADFNLYWSVWDRIKEKYYDQSVPDTQLFYGSLEGMATGLGDPYTAFYNPEITKQFTSELEGKFEGIGAEIAIKNNILTIVAPLAGTPADKAGLKAGDYILKIDNQETQNMSLNYAVSLIRGYKDTTVTLTILRGDWKEPKDFAVVRNTINVNSVTWEFTSDNLAVIKISHFNDNTWNLFNQAVVEITSDKKIKGIILDLRNNPGGYLTTAIQVASEWLPDSIIVQEQGRDGQSKVYRSVGSSRLKDLLTVVLINEGSASGSEIVAGALQDLGASKLIGKKSFGKGSVQDFEVFSDGSSLKITISKWLTPKGTHIDKVGIAPDVEVDLTEEDFNKNLDPQFDKAKEILLGGKK